MEVCRVEDALIVREQRGNISVLDHGLSALQPAGPKLINAIVEQIEAARDAGSRAIVLRQRSSAFLGRRRSPIFSTKRVEQGSGDSSSENPAPERVGSPLHGTAAISR